MVAIAVLIMTTTDTIIVTTIGASGSVDENMSMKGIDSNASVANSRKSAGD
jgi:hypothetical protein